jgi:hypothetical protein
MAYEVFPLLISRAPAATPTVFTAIAELDVVGLPEVSSTATDASVQNKLADIYVMSTLQRRTAPMFTMNFLPADGTQDHLTGLYNAKYTTSFDGYKFSHAASALVWIASGFVEKITPKTAFEGKLQADVTLRFSGPWLHNGVVVGS